MVRIPVCMCVKDIRRLNGNTNNDLIFLTLFRHVFAFVTPGASSMKCLVVSRPHSGSDRLSGADGGLSLSLSPTQSQGWALLFWLGATC